MANGLAQAGQFCPNEACAFYGQVEAAQIIRFGKTRNGKQRYRCKGCGRTFTETLGTVFYRRQAARERILETLALLAEGVRITQALRIASGRLTNCYLAFLSLTTFDRETTLACCVS